MLWRAFAATKEQLFTLKVQKTPFRNWKHKKSRLIEKKLGQDGTRWSTVWTNDWRHWGSRPWDRQSRFTRSSIKKLTFSLPSMSYIYHRTAVDLDLNQTWTSLLRVWLSVLFRERGALSVLLRSSGSGDIWAGMVRTGTGTGRKLMIRTTQIVVFIEVFLCVVRCQEGVGSSATIKANNAPSQEQCRTSLAQSIICLPRLQMKNRLVKLYMSLIRKLPFALMTIFASRCYLYLIDHD